MAVITQTNLKALTDRLGGSYDRLVAGVGSDADVAAPLQGRVMRSALSAANVVIATSDDYYQQQDMAIRLQAVADVTAETLAADKWRAALTAINTHFSRRSASASLGAWLTALNATPFTCLVSPSFAALYLEVMGSALDDQNVFHPAIHPVNGNASGMGTFTFGGAFAAGQAPTIASYAEVLLIAELTANQVGAASVCPVTAVGVDHLGNAAQNFTANLPSGAITAALSLTHSGGAKTSSLTSGEMTTFTVADTTGVVVGSVLKIAADAQTNNYEWVVVNSVPNGTTFTAWTLFDHANSCVITGNYSIALPHASGRRCRSLTNITYTGTSLSAGAVRVVGVQDRARF